MTNTEMVKFISEHILQKINKADSNGLYNGKAGLALSLFIASEYLKDEKMEDTAYDLLMESLLDLNNNLSFEDGLAGIGYSLLYLIENNYLEADFDDVFGNQYIKIINNFSKIDQYPQILLKTSNVIFFLSKAENVKKDDTGRIRMIQRKFFEGLEFYLTIQFYDFADIHYTNKKVEVMNYYNTYLKLVDYSGYSNFSRTLLEDYSVLYRKGKIVSSLETGYYLNRITIRNCINSYDDVINENINSGIKNYYPDTLSLKGKIDWLKMNNTSQSDQNKASGLSPDILDIYSEDAVNQLTRMKDGSFQPFGYGSGLGRLLIFCVDENIELL